MIEKTKREQMKCKKRRSSQKDYLNLKPKFQTLTSENNAITLIALIITIIVMLILVGVTVRIAINGGLFANAKQAKINTQNSIDSEVALSNGRIKIDGTWYDSMEKYIEGVASENQNDKVVEAKEIKDSNGKIINIVYGNKILQVGDYVNYEELIKTNPITIDENTQVMKDLQECSGYNDNSTKTQTYIKEYPLKQETDLKWRVLDIKNGKIRLISQTPTKSTVYLYSFNGYNNAVYLLDEVCDALYTVDGKGKAQSIKIEDIQNKMDLNVWDYHNYVYTTEDNSMKCKYNDEKEYTESNNRYYPEIFLKEKTGNVDDKQGTELDLSEQKELIKGSYNKLANNKIKITHTLWVKELEENNWKNPMYQEIFLNDSNKLDYGTYWVSSRCVCNDGYRGVYSVDVVDEGYVTAAGICSSSNIDAEYALYYRPVVSLDYNIQIGDKINNVWQLK